MVDPAPSEGIFFVTPMKSVGTLRVTEGLKFYSEQHYAVSGGSQMYLTSTTIIHIFCWVFFFFFHHVPLNLHVLFQVFSISFRGLEGGVHISHFSAVIHHLLIVPSFIKLSLKFIFMFITML